MATNKPTLELDLPEFYQTLRFVSESLTGDFGVQELEKRVRVLSETTPFLMKILAAIGEAQRRMDAIRDIPTAADDPEMGRQFLNHNETFCCLQGSLASFMIVSEILRKQAVPKPRTRRKKP